MKFFTQYYIYSFLHATDKRIILAYIFTIVSFASQAGATRFNNYTQQWPLSVNNKSDWKVQYEATISTSIMVPDKDQEMTFLLSEGRGTEKKTLQNNDSQLYWEIFIDKTREHSNASGIQTSETDKKLPGNILGSSTAIQEKNFAKMYNGHVGLWTEVTNDETEEHEYRKQETMRSTIAEELIEKVYSHVSPVFSELLNLEGNYNLTCIRF
jgi:hypothetical protein